MKAVVLAGGRGTRLAPYRVMFPKPLLPIVDMPILEIVVRQLKRFGFDEIILAVGQLGELLMAYFNDGSRFGVHITYSIEDHPLGTAGPLALINHLDTPFLVMNGDILTDLDMSALYRYHQEQQAYATIAMHRRSVKIDLGVIQTDGDRRIIGYNEKPTYQYHVSMGAYVFDPHVLTYIPPGGYMNYPELVLRLVAAKERIMGYQCNGYWLDVGRPDDYAQANEEFDRLRHLFLPPGS